MTSSEAGPEDGGKAPKSQAGMGEAVALGAVSSITNILGTVLRSKVTAVWLGPEGVGRMAEILQFVSLANLPATLLTGPALLSALAKARADGDSDAAARIIRTTASVVLSLVAVGGIVSMVLGVVLLPWTRHAWPLLVLAAASGGLTAWAGVPQQVLVAYGALRGLFVVRFVSSILGLGLIVAGTIALGLPGQFIALTVVAALTLPLAMRMSRRQTGHAGLPGGPIDRSVLVRAFQFGAAWTVSAGATQLMLTITRWTIDRQGGPALNGQFQASWAIASMYFAVMFDGVGSYVNPRFAAAETAADLSAEIDRAASFVWKTVPPVVLAAIAFRDILIHAVYSHRFDGAIDLLGFMLIGDVARAVSWIQGGPLLYRNRVRAYVISEVIAASLQAAGVFILVPLVGLRGVGFAYTGMYVCYAFITAIIARISCGVPVRLRRLAIMLLFTGGAIAAMLATQRVPSLRWVLGGISLFWAHRVGLVASTWVRVKGVIGRLRGAVVRRRAV